MLDSLTATELFRTAARLNREDELMHGSLLEFPDFGQLVMTGDLHGHQRNLQRLWNYCDLDHTPARHVVLQELIHTEPAAFGEPDMSHLVLLEAAQWKCEFPEQVHFLQSNHELSQLIGHEISKAGRIVTHDFVQGISATYGDRAEVVYDAILDFIQSFALAGRTANRIFLSHSLPGARELKRFDPAILTQPLASQDLSERGSAYQLVWGRYQTAEVIEELAKALDVDIFICGHQPQETGYEVVHDRMLIIASDHNHGVFIPFDLKKPHTIDDLVGLMRPLASLA
jgi:hypothetical protein